MFKNVTLLSCDILYQICELCGQVFVCDIIIVLLMKHNNGGFWGLGLTQFYRVQIRGKNHTNFWKMTLYQICFGAQVLSNIYSKFGKVMANPFYSFLYGHVNKKV